MSKTLNDLNIAPKTLWKISNRFLNKIFAGDSSLLF